MRHVVLLVLLLLAATAHSAELRDLRIWETPEATRVVLDLSKDTSYKVFTLPDPFRVVVDLAGVSEQTVKRINATRGQGLVRSVRGGIQPGAIRVVLDVGLPLKPEVSVLRAPELQGLRLVVDLPDATRATVTPPPNGVAPIVARTPSSAAAPPSAIPPPQGMTESTPIDPPMPRPAAAPAVAEITPAPTLSPVQDRAVVVVVDAGHGGEDPGALGQTGLQEKEVALSIARKLAQRINAQPNMRAVLTRDGDYYVGLRDRINIARKHQADLFVSVHANAFTRRDMRGTSVYVVSDKGASSEHARWLAQKENEADLVGGVEIHGKDRELAAVLIDLSQSATMEASFDVASRILRAMSRVNVLQKPDVQQAGFLVLKAPDIPSVLVETAFITNDLEERLLADDQYQDQMAQSIFDGVQGYFQGYRPQQRMAGAAPVNHTPLP